MKIYTEIRTSYIPDEDITIVWQDMYKYADGHGDELIQTTIVGWYCGEPDEKTTKSYSCSNLIGQYID